MKKFEPEILAGVLQSGDRESEYLQTLAKDRKQQEVEKIIQKQQKDKEKRQERKRGR